LAPKPTAPKSTSEPADAQTSGWETICRALFNSAEFRRVD
jgi:hypothetical protein